MILCYFQLSVQPYSTEVLPETAMKAWKRCFLMVANELLLLIFFIFVAWLSNHKKKIYYYFIIIEQSVLGMCR